MPESNRYVKIASRTQAENIQLGKVLGKIITDAPI
jgi:hypothetical protein